MYIKKIDGVMIGYTGPAMGATWTATNGWLWYDGVLPLDRLDIVDGAVVELPEPPQTHDWQDKQIFINALYALIPPETIARVMADAEVLKGAVAGMALLTTDKAPGNIIDMLDPLVTQWLAIGGLTVEQVKAKMEELSNVQ